MPATHYPFYLGSQPQAPNHDLVVTNKYTGEPAAHVAQASRADVEAAVAIAAAAAAPMRALKAYERQNILYDCVARIEAQREELATMLCIEAGKPIIHARGEVARLIDTFRIAGEEAVRITGEVLPMDITSRAANYTGMVQRVPIGSCSFITPFNFPLNLAAHKVAPAIAAGCPFILKPAGSTPVTSLMLGQVLAETELPEGAFSILTCASHDASPMVEDDRIKLLSFTGSGEVGWKLKAQAGRKKVHLELGGNAAVIVDRDVDLDDAVERLVFGAFYQSGQSCISVQRIYAHETIYDALRDRMVQATRQLKMGDPLNEQTFIGPLITADDAARINQWIDQARQRGATVLCGGRHDGAMHEPTLVEKVPHDLPLSCQEVFGPVAVLNRFSDFADALARANDSPFGLQAGVFTRDLHHAHQAWNMLDVGGVIINDVPSWRVDHMPYGGVKESGLGREGPRYAIEEMTEMRLMAMRWPQA